MFANELGINPNPQGSAQRSPHLDDGHDDEGVAEDGGEAGGVEGEGEAEAGHLGHQLGLQQPGQREVQWREFATAVSPTGNINKVCLFVYTSGGIMVIRY